MIPPHEVFDYPMTRLDPARGDHVDPPSVAAVETLLRKGQLGQPWPGLARHWTVDGSTRRLQLRADARFRSGDVCDSNAVIGALENHRWGDAPKRQVSYWAPGDTVIANDAATIGTRLDYPCARLTVLLWGTHTAFMNPRERERLGDAFGIVSADGTGTYRLTKIPPGVVVIEHVHPAHGPERIRWTGEVDDSRRWALCADITYMPLVSPVESAGVRHDIRGYLLQPRTFYPTCDEVILEGAR